MPPPSPVDRAEAGRTGISFRLGCKINWLEFSNFAIFAIFAHIDRRKLMFLRNFAVAQMRQNPRLWGTGSVEGATRIKERRCGAGLVDSGMGGGV